MSTQDNNKEYTVGEFEEMDLSELHDKLFMVAANTGPMSGPAYMCSTLCGPFGFYEMVEVVGNIYEEHTIHAKVMIPSKTFGKKPELLDENTIDFIEARYMDIITRGLIDNSLYDDIKYTCKAGFIEIEEAEDDADEATE